MKIRLLTITHKVPNWIETGYQEYASRLPKNCALELIEIPTEKRNRSTNIAPIIKREGEKLLAASKAHHLIIALDVKGKLWSTKELVKQLADWQQHGDNVDLLIGGPDGLSSQCIKEANRCWSLSPLTFPHILVRLIIAEQIYRAWSILQQHPYHR
ncbi:MAG: 23S rRNA (pseudouridine(1915)-N(3))-methyltransferase RlmH [Gammaproteobacteria bacterium RIFCSPHIGHO2_12_FULL_37_34]|nr:MAG: 23S rRNA (pseudouridine(1915)-N(3))-methyltransferase RlmH [Gammaproteobacteria bacterium RIFCSPHIGHO2_12_FULL_37_34]